MAVMVLAQTAGAQEPQPRVRSTAGPRLGVTYLGSYRPPNLLTGKKLSSVMTQFGWHSEQAVFPFNGGPTLVVEEAAAPAFRRWRPVERLPDVAGRFRIELD